MGTLCFAARFRQWLYPQWKKTTPFFVDVKWRWIQLVGYMLVSGVMLMACSGPAFGGSATPQGTAAVKQIALSQFHWCGKPLMVFRDEGATTGSGGAPKTVADWVQVKADLGFTVFLPAALPAGACLMSASATIHDPIFGGNFTIGYLLPDHSSISFSEAPLRAQNTAFQCSPSPAGNSTKPVATTKTGAKTQSSMQLCSGARDTTHIVFSAQGATPVLAQFFQHLQPNIAWIPA
ncbi:hypothetical protein KSF_021120 [Reticulibacter mediterranei]|uniref:Uncharacterized protein n=1 Tax=Reticulibacter mediterranei TaxID=2778369 RepID=A0A8J3MYH8_9CHLR|nr:hypothetical protein [Reticulibacter mediterranei]GHO92064.1 hypothetical protein KSF_021120 [Reticulibacter mediterranei]